MEYGVHIITLGRKAEIALAAVQHSGRKDKIWLINKRGKEIVDGESIDYGAVEEEVITRFKNAMVFDVEVFEITNQFDYNEVYRAVIDIARNEREAHPGCRFYINFTRGTSIMSGAACSAAYAIGADLYYVQEGKYNEYGRDDIIEIQVDRLSEISVLNSKKKTRFVLERFHGHEPMDHPALLKATGMKASALSPHLNLLKAYGLVINEGSSKAPIWKLTDRGRDVLNRLYRGQSVQLPLTVVDMM
ncbi:MAG: DUF6293 family protein [archaeon]|nr:DUF6293 family protein [archaeon]